MKCGEKVLELVDQRSESAVTSLLSWLQDACTESLCSLRKVLRPELVFRQRVEKVSSIWTRDVVLYE